MTGFVHIRTPLAAVLKDIAAQVADPARGHVITAGSPGLVDFEQGSPSAAALSSRQTAETRPA